MPDVNAELLETVTALRSELRFLSDRVAALEGNGKPKQPVAVSAAKALPEQVPVVVPESISEETVLVISAAVAAFLGKRAPIRQIRLIGSTGWALQGRVFIQASHNLVR